MRGSPASCKISLGQYHGDVVVVGLGRSLHRSGNQSPQTTRRVLEEVSLARGDGREFLIDVLDRRTHAISNFGDALRRSTIAKENNIRHVRGEKITKGIPHSLCKNNRAMQHYHALPTPDNGDSALIAARVYRNHRFLTAHRALR